MAGIPYAASAASMSANNLVMASSAIRPIGTSYCAAVMRNGVRISLEMPSIRTSGISRFLGRDFMSSINVIAHRPSMRWQPFASQRGSGPSAFKEHYKLSSSECKSKNRESFKKFATIPSVITIHFTIYFHPYNSTHIL
jgi:hypothetical protein